MKLKYFFFYILLLRKSNLGKTQMQVVSFFFPFTLFFKLTIKKERSLERLSASSSQMDLNRKKLMINDKLEFTVAEAHEW